MFWSMRSCPWGRGARLTHKKLPFILAWPPRIFSCSMSCQIVIWRNDGDDVRPPWVAGSNVLVVRRSFPANTNSLTGRRHSWPYRNTPLHRLSYAISTFCVKRYEYTNWDSPNKVRPSKLQASKQARSPKVIETNMLGTYLWLLTSDP